MDFSVISLIVLVVVVAIGFIKKVNLGFLSLGVAFILGTCGGMSAKEIAGGFSSSMFVTLVGVTFLFGMASANGTLELFSKKVVALVGKHTVLIPVLMFFLSAFISAIGPGHIAAGILMTTFAMYLAFEMDINPVATALFAKLGANAGCASPLSLTGVLAKSLAEPLGYDGFGLHLFLSTLISGFLFTLILYIAFKSYKVKADNPLKLSEISKFNRDQLCTIAAIIVMVICCIGFQLDTGLFAFVAASVLILLGCADEKKAIKSIPWGTLVFICGVGALINVIKKLGGIDLISNFLTGLMTEKTATPILAATSGILSWVSSGHACSVPHRRRCSRRICRLCQLRGTDFHCRCNIFRCCNQPSVYRWCYHHVLLLRCSGNLQRRNEQDVQAALPAECRKCSAECAAVRSGHVQPIRPVLLSIHIQSKTHRLSTCGAFCFYVKFFTMVMYSRAW